MLKILEFFRRSRPWALLGGLLVLGLSGCVDINDAKVEVRRTEVDPYGRNILDKCPIHTYPHRLILAQTGSSTPLGQSGPQLIYNQADFDKWWVYVNSAVGNDQVSTSSLSQQPLINWDQQTVDLFVVNTNNSCEKTKPYGDEMTTDCYNILIQLYRYVEGTNCQQPPGSFDVFIYIFPKTPLPINVAWTFPTPIPTPPPQATATPTRVPARAPTPTPVPAPQSEEE